MKIKRLFTLLCAITLGISVLSAQTSGGNSPYSRYGWGTLCDESQGFNKGMAGVALGYSGGKKLNFKNPASYASIDSLTFLFDIGISLQKGNFKEGDKAKNASNSTLDYIEAGFSLTQKLGFSLGMRPYTLVAYDFSSKVNKVDVDGYGNTYDSYNYNGEGGTHLAWIGLGWSPIKNFNFGFNGGFIWGDYTHNVTASNSNTSIYNLARAYKATLNTYSLDLGVQYTKEFGKERYATLGLTYNLGHKVDNTSTLITQMRNISSSISGDTITIGNTFELPHSFGIGLFYHHSNKLSFGLDYTCQLWKNRKFPVLLQNADGSPNYTTTTNQFNNRHKISAGMEYMPNPTSIRVRDHIIYKCGLSYATGYSKVGNYDAPKNYLVSAGMALPIVNNYNTGSYINVALQYEHVAPASGYNLKENYFRLCVGLSFNANWFNKWMIE